MCFKEAGKLSTEREKKDIMGENSEWTSEAALPFLSVPEEHRVTHVHLSMHLFADVIYSLIYERVN